MKESVEGVSNTFGLGASITTSSKDENVPPNLQEFLVADDEIEKWQSYNPTATGEKKNKKGTNWIVHTRLSWFLFLFLNCFFFLICFC